MADVPLFTRELAARRGEPPHPVMLLLHGRGADEEDLLPLAEALDPGWRYVSARAPFALPGFGYAWYEMDRLGTPEPVTLAGSLRQAEAVVDRLAAEAPMLVVCGFSQGAVMAAALLVRRPDRVAAAAMLSGYLAVDPRTAAGKDVFIGHGLLDPLIPVGLGRQARERFAAAGARVDYHEYPIAHQTSPSELTDLGAWMARLTAGRATPAGDPG
jgi:phospholipase/carboxylesterase